MIAAAALGAVVALPSAARAADPDPWLGKDKALHFGAASLIAAGGYTLGALVFDARGHALIAGAALSAAAGIGKETLDLAGYGDPSWRDLAWDGIGMVFGVAAAWGVDLLARGVSERHPLLIAPRVTPQGGALELRIVF
ncbi:hypothetical protein BH11MYX4_BH11MYX4_11740 [soil metagenome]